MNHTRSPSATNAAAAAQAAPLIEQQQQQQRGSQATKPQPAVAATPSPLPPKHARHPSAAAAASSTAPVSAGGGAGGGAGANAGVAAAVQVEATPAARGGGAVSNSVATDATSAPAMPSSTSSSTSTSSGSAGPSDVTDVTDVEAMLTELTSKVIANMKYKPQHLTLTTPHLERAVEVFKAGLAAQEAALLPLGPDFLDFLGMPALQLTTGTTNLLANSDVLNSKAVPGVKVIENADGLWLISLPGRPHAHAKAAIAGQFEAFATAGARAVFGNGGGHWPSSVGPNTRDPDAAISRLFHAPGAAAATVLANDPIVIFEQEEKNRTISDLRHLVDEYFLNPCVEVVIVSKLFHNPTGSHRCGVVMYERTVAPGATTYAVTAQLDIGPSRLTGRARQNWDAPTLPATLCVPQGAWVTWTSTLHPGASPRVTWDGNMRPAGMQPLATTAPSLAGLLAVDPTWTAADIANATTQPLGLATRVVAAWATSPTLTIPRARLVSNVADAHGQLAPHASFAGLTLNVGHMLNACMLLM